MLDRFFLQTSETLLQQVSRSFGEVSHRPQETPILTTAILVAAAILCYLLWKKIASGKGSRWGGGPAMQPEAVTAILQQALMHRSRMDMSFHSIDEVRKTVSCTLHDISDEEIVLEMPVGITPSEFWQDRVMDCFFRIPQPGKGPYFYRFSTSVLRTFRDGGIGYLVLTMPRKVELGQKRRHLRLEVPPADIRDFRIWAPEDGTCPFDTEEEAWPAPLAVYASDGAGMRVMDISGGGIKLFFDPEQYQGLEEFVARNPVLFMRLELTPVAGTEYPPYYIAARLRTSVRDVNSGALLLGYEFVECHDRKATTLDWIRIEPRQGVDDLVNWVFKRHLELYREGEIV